MADGNGATGGEGPRVAVEPLHGSGLRFDDQIDRRTFTVRTDRDVDPEPVPGDRFKYPLDVAVAVTTGHLELLPVGASFLHGPDGSTEIESQERTSHPAGRFVVEISGPIKVYAEVFGPCTVEHEDERLIVDLDRPDSVVVGARSLHERPATTITTTEDPVDLMAAVSTFGSELKTRTCKRSYSTLRGHPPAIEVGENASIPAGVSRADGAIRLTVPRDLEAVLVVAPLAYYLGARVAPGDEAMLHVDGDSYRLDGPEGFEATVERTLKRTMFMDCLVRTATTRDVMLHERACLADELPVDVDALEGRPPADRLTAYQRVPYETIAPHLPDWRTVAHVQPTPAGIETLPFLANDLAIIRIPDAPEHEERHLDATGADPAGGSGGGPAPPTQPGGDGGDATIGGTTATGPREFVRPPDSDAVGQTWVGPGVPIGATKALPTAFHNRLERDRRDDETVEVAVVCNDEEMVEEGESARRAYGSNQHLPFEVSVRYHLDTADLGGVFESDLDYVHYVGHVGAGGFECPDGTLDVASLVRVGVDIAFLNACQSYEQGVKLIDQGAIASVVTFGEVLDEGALRIGTTMARLLNQGFSIELALSIARDRSIVGSQYLVLGDADADIAQPSYLIPWVTHIDSVRPETYRVSITPYPTKSSGMGSQFHPSFGEDPSVHLVPKTLPPVEMSTERLREYLVSRESPVIMDGDLIWSDDAIARL